MVSLREADMSTKKATVLLLSTFFVLGGDQALANWSARDSLALQILRLEIQDTGKVARIYYAAACENAREAAWGLPWLEVHAPPETETGLDAVRAIFENYDNVIVTEDPSGIIRIRIGDFPDAILDTRIAQINLTSEEQYNPGLALSAVSSIEEVVAEMEGLGSEPLVTIFIGSVSPPDPALPHMRPSMRDVTLDEALDEVALSFNGMVTYAACAETGLIDFDFVPMNGY
jgi:hypothetical protein